MRYAKQILSLLLAASAAVVSAQSDTISVTVSLQTSLGVSLDESAWSIGPIALSGTANLADVVATNTGNTPEDFAIKAGNGAGGWTIGPASAANVFMVLCDLPDPGIDFVLSATDKPLADEVPFGASNTVTFGLNYTAPASDTFGAGVAQGFDITITATAD